MVAVAVERRAPGQPGEKPIPGLAALAVVPSAAASRLHGFLPNQSPTRQSGNQPWLARLPGAGAQGFPHTATPLPGDPEAAHRLFPWLYIARSHRKRFLLGTPHKVESQHLQSYLAEFNYRLKRRTLQTNRFHRLVRACLTTHTVSYKELITVPDPA